MAVSRSAAASGKPPRRRRGFVRPAAFIGLVALLLNLLVPLAVVAAATAPAPSDAYICHAASADDGRAAPAGGGSGPSVSHHCPLCVALSGGLAASQHFAYAAVLPPPPGRLRPVAVAAALAPAALRLIAPQPRAPPAIPA